MWSNNLGDQLFGNLTLHWTWNAMTTTRASNDVTSACTEPKMMAILCRRRLDLATSSCLALLCDAAVTEEHDMHIFKDKVLMAATQRPKQQSTPKRCVIVYG